MKFRFGSFPGTSIRKKFTIFYLIIPSHHPFSSFQVCFHVFKIIKFIWYNEWKHM